MFGNAEGVASVFAEEADHGLSDGLHDQCGEDIGGVFDGFDFLDENVEDLELQGCAVLEGGGGVVFTETARVGCVELDGEVRERGDALGVRDVGDGCEFVEGRRKRGREGVVVIVDEEVGALKICVCCDEGGVRILGGVVGEIFEGFADGCVCGGRVDGVAAPHKPLGEGFQVEAGDDAEVVAAAAEGKVEVWVRLLVNVPDLAVRQYYLVIM